MEKISKEKMRLKQQHKISKVSFFTDKLVLHIDGKQYEFSLSKISDKLAKASKIELENYKVSPSGYGIYWPLLDEDLSIDGLLKTTLLVRKATHLEKA